MPLPRNGERPPPASVEAVLANAGSTTGFVLSVIGGVLVGGVLYCLPSVVAWDRGVPNVGSVIVINVLLGWTLVGWAVAMAMAVRTVPSVSSQATSVSVPGFVAPPPPPRPLQPGWHADPWGGHKARWHDGERWTSSVITQDGQQVAEP